MGTPRMATAAGMAVVLYFVVSRRLAAAKVKRNGGGDASKTERREGRRVTPRPVQPPTTWWEAAAMLADTLRFTYSETLGKWPIGDLAFGIKYLMRLKGDLNVASVYAGSDCVELRGLEIMAELDHLLRLLNLCLLFSKKPFPVFLESAGYSQDDVLLQEPKAGLLKPAFTIICDKNSRCFLLLIRGTHSIKDTLTAATGAVVPFHHLVLDDVGVNKLVLGYAHCGMVAAARWIAKCITPYLTRAVAQHPHYKIKIVGHSLGGGTAALLSYVLREHKELYSSTCITFAPAACMTWDLAESGKDFITTIVNGSDLVPTFSAASLDELRSEVTASSWLNDLRNQMQQTRILNSVYHFASALGSHFPYISSARARVPHPGTILQPVPSKTQVIEQGAKNSTQPVSMNQSSLSSWSCMGVYRRALGIPGSTKEEKEAQLHSTSQSNSEAILVEHCDIDMSSSSRASYKEETDDEELVPADQVNVVSTAEEIAEGKLWLELEKELGRHDYLSDDQAQEEMSASVKDITDEESAPLKAAEDQPPISTDFLESHQLYPPGKIMHIVALPISGAEDVINNEYNVGIYGTPRYLYSKIRLSRTMINDHYMPMYKKMMELLIDKLAKDNHDCRGTFL